jgi:SAM-dependent methyltransferase
MTRETHCPLCKGFDLSPYALDKARAYLSCGTCQLVFVPPEHYLSRELERAEYDLHENDVDDAGYRGFLSRLAEPMAQRLKPGARGLDFGCGPEPALARMLEEKGFVVALYDSFYQPEETAVTGSYDFICATEVVEHLHFPGDELERLWSLLKPGSWLGIMTKLVKTPEAFATWHYKNDPTHVCFFSTDTWQWWAQEHATEAEFIGADVIMLRRSC